MSFLQQNESVLFLFYYKELFHHVHSGVKFCYFNIFPMVNFIKYHLNFVKTCSITRNKKHFVNSIFYDQIS